MKKTIKKALSVLLLGVALSGTQLLAQPITLTGTNYFQNFDAIGDGLPGEWLIYTVATSSSLGTLSTAFKQGATNGWADTSGGFKNYANSTNDVAGTNFLGTEATSVQNTVLNRSLGVRPVSATDAGNAFVLKVANTTGFGKFKLDVDMLLLNPQTRSNNWTLDFGVSPDGSSAPTTFTVVSNNFFGTYTVASAFGAYHRTLDFGNLLDNQPGPIWIRIWNTASSGTGSRPTVGIDNFNLSFTNVSEAVLPPAITTAPQSTTAYVGEAAKLTVANSGTAPFTYQWYHNNFDTPVGDGTATYNIAAVSASDAGSYYVVIANSVGSTTNNPPAVLTVSTRVPIPTTIAQIRTNQDLVNWTPVDTTNFYTVTGIVTTRVNMTTSANSSFYIEDTNSLCGIDVFIGGDTTTRPALGDVVQVTGPLGNFSGVLEFNLSASNPNHIVNNLGPSGYSVPAKPFVLSSALNIPLMETNVEGSLVAISNVYLQNGGTGSNFLSGGTVLLTNLTGQTFQLFVDSRLTDIVGQPIPQFAASITGYMAQHQTAAPYTTNYQVIPTYLGDIVAGTVPTVQPVLSLTQTGGSLTLSWNGTAVLQSATNVAGPYVEVSGATSPFTTNAAASSVPVQFFRLYQAQ